MSCPRQSQGFALVIALSLMAFMLLLLLSLSSLVQVESRSAKISQATHAAQQNALLGLQEALGELQKNAGPDQRITATGSLWKDHGTGTQNLIGIWSSEDENSDGLPDGTFLRWMLSQQDDTVAETANLAQQNLPIAHNGNHYESTNDNYVLLVGSGSTRHDSNQADEMQGVVAQKKPVISNSGHSNGNYAWWVGDEGVKASIGIIDPKAGTPSPILSMPRAAPETIETLDFISANDSTLLKLQSARDLIHFTGATEDAIRESFHTVTHQTWGVQSSTRNGGLKKDLSLLFEMDEDSWNASDFVAKSPTLYKNAPVVGDVPLLFQLGEAQKIDGLDVNVTVGDKKLYGPTWNKLRDYYRSYKAVTNKETSPTIQARPAYPAVSDMPYDTHKERWSHSSSRQTWRNWLENSPNVFREATAKWDDAPTQFVRSTGVPITPYLSRVTLQVSLEVTEQAPNAYSGTWVLLPVICLHNPYNITITTNQSRFLWAIRNHKVFYDVNGGTLQKTWVPGIINADSVLWGDGGQGEAEFIIPPSTFRPGEVLTFTPKNGAWGKSVEMQASTQINLQAGGDGLRLPEQTLTGITDASTDTFRSRYTMDGWTKYAWELQNANGDYDTMAAAMCINPQELKGFEWQPEWVQNLNNTREWLLDELIDVRTAITTFDFYVKPVDLVYPASHAPNLEALAFPTFIASNPLSSGDERLSAAGQGSPFLSPLRAGYVADGLVDEQIISDCFNGQGQGYWGAGVDYGSSFTSILDVPTAPIHSIGHMQHVNLIDQPHYPALAIGNSFTTPFLQSNTSVYYSYSKYGGQKAFYDLSYLANRALWDDYFFSTIAPEETDSSYNDASPNTAGNVSGILDAVLDGQRTLHNPRMQVYWDGMETNATTKSLLSDYKTSASRLMVSGAFNINSTSVDAWRAFLAGLKAADIQRNEQGNLVADQITGDAAFLRNSIPTGSAVTGGTYTDEASWNAFHALSESELDALANAIVEEIKLRALELGTSGTPSPFGSLSNFVNRMPYAETAGYTQLGLLQAAINKSGLNNHLNSATEFDTNDWNSSRGDITTTGDNWPEDKFHNPDCKISTASCAPTHLLQSDILQQIAPYISTRSDTFKIRTYGEKLDPITSEPEGKAWLEAVVQRSPVPVNPSTSNPQEPENPNKMGRKFEIVSLRWLSQEEI